jgi:hypothetical protein
MSELYIERLKTDPAYRAERAALRNGRKPIEPKKPIVEPEPIINAHMAPADRAHWDMMNDWFQRSFEASFEKHFDGHIDSTVNAIAEAIESHHIDTLMLAALIRSMIGINRNGIRPDLSTLNEVQDELDALRKSLGITIEEGT